MRFLYLFVCFFLLEVTARISRIQTGLASLWDLITRHKWRRPDGPDAGRFRTSVLCSDLECGLVGLLCNTTERIRVICKDAFTNKTCSQCSLCTYPQYPQNRVLPASTLFRLARQLQGTAVVEWHQGAKKGSRTTSGGKWAGAVDLLLRFFFVDRYTAKHVFWIFLDVFGEVLQVFPDGLVFACYDFMPWTSIWCAQVLEFLRGYDEAERMNCQNPHTHTLSYTSLTLYSYTHIHTHCQLMSI